MQDELKHYGVLGMKWGVRRANKYREKHTIKKGTKIHRSSGDANESIDGHKYVTYLKPERDLYRSASYSKTLLKNQGKNSNANLYEHTYKLKKDLTVASRKEVQDIVGNLIRKDKKNNIMRENGKSYYYNFRERLVDEQYTSGHITADQYKKYLTDPKYRKEVDHDGAAFFGKMYVKQYAKAAKEDPNSVFTITMQSLGTSQYNKEAIIKQLKKRGYNAMTDEASVGTTTAREGVDPLIIFDGADTLEKIGTKKVNFLVKQMANDRYVKWKRLSDDFGMAFQTEW